MLRNYKNKNSMQGLWKQKGKIDQDREWASD